jgi:hypothetical protein
MLRDDILKLPIRVSYLGTLEDRLAPKRGTVSGDTLSELARKAATFAGTKLPDLFWRIATQEAGGVLFHGWNDNVEVYLGPTIGPPHPDALSPEHGYRWELLSAHLDLESTRFRHLGRCIVGRGS